MQITIRGGLPFASTGARSDAERAWSFGQVNGSRVSTFLDVRCVKCIQGFRLQDLHVVGEV
jgi:hypothetical protein